MLVDAVEEVLLLAPMFADVEPVADVLPVADVDGVAEAAPVVLLEYAPVVSVLVVELVP